MEHPLLCGVYYDLDVSQLTVTGVPDRPGAVAGVFAALARAGICPADVQASPAAAGRRDVTLLLSGAQAVRAGEVVRTARTTAGFDDVRCDHAIGQVSLAGFGLAATAKTMARFMEILSEARIDTRLTSMTNTRIAALTGERDTLRAAEALCAGFAAPGPAPTPAGAPYAGLLALAVDAAFDERGAAAAAETPAG